MITSNLRPVDLLCDVAGDNLTARAMICNLQDVVLFPIIDEIINVHILEPLVANLTVIPDDVLGY